MLLTNVTEVCFLCEGEIHKGESAVVWECADGSPLYSHATCHHKYEILTERHHYTQQQAKRMLTDHILVFTGGD